MKLVSRHHDDAHNETGFTLFELLIVMIVIPIVVGALAFAVVAIFSLSGATTASVSLGSNVQSLTPAFQEDIHNAIALTTCSNVDGATTCSATTANDAQCGPSSYPLIATFAFSNSFGTNANPSSNQAPTGPIVSYVGAPVNTVTTTGITAASWAAGTMTFTAINQYHVGEQVTVTGVTPDGYNGNWIISAETANSFSVVNAQALTPGTSFGVVKQTLYNLLRTICTNGASSTFSSSQVLANSISGAQISFLEDTCANATCTSATAQQSGAPFYSTGANWVFTGQAACQLASQSVPAVQLTITEADTVSSANVTASPNDSSQLGASCG
jgi:prepilin-type N-terminal cleavage/methylation domain-containing protein